MGPERGDNTRGVLPAQCAFVPGLPGLRDTEAALYMWCFFNFHLSLSFFFFFFKSPQSACRCILIWIRGKLVSMPFVTDGKTEKLSCGQIVWSYFDASHVWSDA